MEKLPLILRSRTLFCIIFIAIYYLFNVYFKINPIDVIFSFFKFFIINLASFIVLYLASKKENQKEKILLFIVSIISLVISYYLNITNNIGVLLFYFSQHYEKKTTRLILNSVVIVIFLYPFISPIYYRYSYGIPEKRVINIENLPNIVLLNNSEKEIFSTEKHTIEMTRVASIEAEAKVVFVEHYDSPFSYDYYENDLYDDVAPLDLSIFVGDTAKNWKKYKVKHEQRLMIVLNQVNLNEFANLHIIPANDIIRKGFKTISRGDDVYLKGYLIDWNGIGEYDYFKIKTARSFNEESKERPGGNFALLCLQFFVEELNANGYTFK